eukprot:c34914_g1_i1.p2 GENE.c34914_g1_i1~~c34914_g1_i1.p2  ORF type:complete len:133 (+),score=6.57 c34914_g1_i1:62-460(+)
MVMAEVTFNGLLSSFVQSKCHNILDTMTVASINARCCPMHTLLPPLNGTNCPAGNSFLLNRSGSNSFAVFPHNLSNLFIVTTGINNMVRLGIFFPPKTVSSTASRAKNGTGGYNLITSLKTKFKYFISDTCS